MRIFACPACGGTLFFHNSRCACGAEVAYAPEADAFEPLRDPCANRGAIDCNWAAPAPGALCRACATTEVIPDAFHDDNRALWAEAEAAKRWVLANLGRWGWFGDRDPGLRPRFHLLSERTRSGRAPVVMGHASGLVTINVVEADPAELVRRRQALGEPYRTMIGHFRHELAHFLFERLAAAPAFVEGFRALFGDERADYAKALERHYAEGPPEDWAERCVTPYAAAHPHEDWAESVAHLLHLTDLADSAAAAGLAMDGAPPRGWDAYAEADAARLIGAAAGLGLAFNHVNRSMGLFDLYPFVLGPLVRDKLGFAHARLRAGPAGGDGG